METARTLKERLFLPGVLVVFLRMASFSTVTSADDSLVLLGSNSLH